MHGLDKGRDVGLVHTSLGQQCTVTGLHYGVKCLGRGRLPNLVLLDAVYEHLHAQFVRCRVRWRAGVWCWSALLGGLKRPQEVGGLL